MVYNVCKYFSLWGDFTDSYLSFESFRYAYTKSLKPSRTEFPYHLHKKYEILYFLEGDAECVVGNMRHRLSRGDLALIPRLHGHYIGILSDKPYERIVLNFDADCADGKKLAYLFSTPKIIATSKPLQDIFERFQEYYEMFSGDERNLLFKNLLTELIFLLCASAQESELESFSGFGKLMERVLNYIDLHLFQLESIDEICKDLYISRAYLHKLFTATLGTSPMKYIKTKRLLAAREMIRIGEKPTNVYIKVKYNDYTTFYRAYKEFFGYSPSDTAAD